MAIVDMDSAGNPPASQAVPGRAMVRWLPHVTSFCCCLGLGAGAKLVGFINLLVSLTLVAVCAFYGVVFAIRARSEPPEDRVYGKWQIIALVGAVLSMVHVALGLTLIVGVVKQNTSCLRVWVVCKMVLFTSMLALLLVNTALTGFNGTGSDNFLSLLGGLLFFGVLGYFIIVVNSYYMLVKSSSSINDKYDHNEQSYQYPRQDQQTRPDE